MTTEALRAARLAWADAHCALDACLTRVLPYALAADQAAGENLQEVLTPEQAREISGLYGRTLGAWAHYRELLREAHDADESAVP